MSKNFLLCPECKKERLRPFRIFPRRGEPDVLQQVCKECGYPLSKEGERLIISDLPKIQKKKLIYLDQNIISDITRALHPSPLDELKPDEEKRALEIFSKLDYLRKAQCIVCPYSWDHRGESVVAKDITKNTFRDLMRVYQYLANNIRFVDSFGIDMDQVLRFAREWVTTKQYGAIDYRVGEVLETRPHHWYWEDSGPFSYIIMEGEAEERTKINDEVYKDVLEVYRRWRVTPDDKITEEESLAFSKHIFKEYMKEIALKMELTKGRRIEELQSYIPDSRFPAQLLWKLQEIFDTEEGTDKGMRKKEAFVEMKIDPLANMPLELVGTFETLLGLPIRYIPEMKDMLESEEFRKYVPFVRIESVMNSYLGKVVKRRTAEIDQGEMTDIIRIAHHLPYCDAIFTDRFWSVGFSDKFMTDRIETSCRFFHLKDYEKFIAYLDEIEKEYAGQIALAQAHLGDLSPNMSLLGKK